MDADLVLRTGCEPFGWYEKARCLRGQVEGEGLFRIRGFQRLQQELAHAEHRQVAVYVFVRQAGQWSQQAFVKASNTGQGHGFGDSVALSADGSTLAVGAATENKQRDRRQRESICWRTQHGRRRVHLQTRAGSMVATSVCEASNTGAGDHFGYSVALADDGRTLAVGAVTEDSNAKGQR